MSSHVTNNGDWLRLWNERGDAVKRALGETIPRDSVVPFSWNSHSLPGACGMAFAPCYPNQDYIYMTLGLTQPVDEYDRCPSWEFAVRTQYPASWPYQLLYDLLTFWLDQKNAVRRGLFLPLAFFMNDNGEVCVGLTSDTHNLKALGSIRGLFLWDDFDGTNFSVSSGDFGLMLAIPVTLDEFKLARETTPPHVLLLLKRMGLAPRADPFRDSVMTVSGADVQWNRIRKMSHEQVVYALSISRSDTKD